MKAISNLDNSIRTRICDRILPGFIFRKEYSPPDVICTPSTMSSLPMPSRPLYYDAKPQTSKASRPETFQSIDPANGKPLADITVASEADSEAAIASAQKAFRSWSRTPAAERSRILHRAVKILRERNDELAKIETHDTGKPFSETSAVDVVTGADVLEYYANLIGAGGLEGERIKLREGVWVNSTREPLGVCVGIGAWNYPIQMCVAFTPRPRHQNVR